MNKSAEALANKDDEKVEARVLDPRAPNKQGFHQKTQVLYSVFPPVHVYLSKTAADRTTTNDSSEKGQKSTRVF